MRHLGFDVRIEVETGDTSRLNVVGNGDAREALGALIGRKGERLSAPPAPRQPDAVATDGRVDPRPRRRRGLPRPARAPAAGHRQPAAGGSSRPARCSSSSRCRPSSGAGSTSPCASIRTSRRSRSARSRTVGSSSRTRGPDQPVRGGKTTHNRRGSTGPRPDPHPGAQGGPPPPPADWGTGGPPRQPTQPGGRGGGPRRRGKGGRPGEKGGPGGEGRRRGHAGEPGSGSLSRSSSAW